MIKFMGQYGRPNLALAGILVNFDVMAIWRCITFWQLCALKGKPLPCCCLFARRTRAVISLAYVRTCERVSVERVNVSCVLFVQSELSQLIHSLSEKARSGTEFIARLKCMQERIEVATPIIHIISLISFLKFTMYKRQNGGS